MPDSNKPPRKRVRLDGQSTNADSSTSARPITTRSRSQSVAQLSKPSSGKAHANDDPVFVSATGVEEEDGDGDDDDDADDGDEDDGEDDGEGDNDDDSCNGDIILTSKYISELGSDKEIVAKLGIVFSDPCTLARSFPQKAPELAAECPVDIPDVRRAYKDLFEHTSEAVHDELRIWTTNTISMMKSDPCHEHDNQINAILILLLNPKLLGYSHAANVYVLPELCSAILSLPTSQQNALMRYFTVDDGGKELDYIDANACANEDDSMDSDGNGELPGEHTTMTTAAAAAAAATTTTTTSTATDSQSLNANSDHIPDSVPESQDNIVPFLRYIGIFQSHLSREINKAAQRIPTPNSTEPATQRVSLHMLRNSPVLMALQCLAMMNSFNNTHSIVPYSKFYNDAVNQHIDIKEDFPRFRMPDGVSFCSYPFLLSPTTKSEVIKIESVILMRTELQDSFFRAMFSGVTCPYLVLEVRRDNLVRDTLYQLDLKLSQDLRKQLKVRFVGEEGVDEGGVQKEFFQLIVRDVFSPKYGVFKANDESHYYWFMPRAEPSKDSLEEMRLTGQLIGLAVYNAVILDIHLPPAMYKKLLDIPVTREDLKEFDPALYRGLMQLLALSAEDLEYLERTFEVEYDDLGEIRTHELVPGGADVQLTVDNREEFIDKYVDFTFNISCKAQFAEFKAGFDRICGGSFVRYMRPQELELLVCGSSDLDFGALESSTIYDGGYTHDTQVIQFFWTVVNEFTDELKRKLLFFATSSDRVPIGGLSKLHFVIAKNGGDSDRLPTSHTCFNVLLLPEYSRIDKLRERLLTAIHNSEGFGMI
ncbi:hypothetical protein GGI12_003069 [Dipsacomyces acuminosporus]|nr:hypothetical protein GGI12_003069 [Dipsacomyces acuminosporus]